jgi:hypothetical protein
MSIKIKITKKIERKRRERKRTNAPKSKERVGHD